MSTIIIGSGIIGLTTAIRILESQSPNSNKEVFIIASRLPTDENLTKDPEYASACAGAHHLSFAADDDERQARWDRRTFEIMQSELSSEGEQATGLMSLRQTEYFTGDEKHLKFLEGYPEFQITPPHLLPPFSTHSVSFRSLTMTPSTYLLRLTRRILELGGKIWRGKLVGLRPLEIDFGFAEQGQEEDQDQSIGPEGTDNLTTTITTFSSEGNPKARPTLPLSALGNIANLILCVGIGASSGPTHPTSSYNLYGIRGLSEKEKQKVFPVTGQVVRIRAPWVKEGFTRQVGSLGGSRGSYQDSTKELNKEENKEENEEENKEENAELNKEEQTDREGGEGGQRTYIIPRSNGEVVLGGTRDIDLWDPTPNPSTTEDILHRCLTIHPFLLLGHPTTPLPASAPMAEKMEVLRGLVEEVVVGYRPSREGGPRVERGVDIDLEIDPEDNTDADVDGEFQSAEERQNGKSLKARKVKKCKVKVFYNYGHGGAGWQACWGAAEETRDLVLAAEGN
ncbi:hypothetical protein HD553DRAFT_318120 [Filobasidium floriforme]|uniref:uncharacterized protein n=1 Tax=Filobasidium floriforme TaxID=5210 RepID=UPI001E8D3DC6|nr:uncharacterized protein HD553DRAFT_318120 [Filobasidium floriforme]KAH8080007.1 hypothetical protein HD553DRAFT_318120 [Filobasidium floriforme]